MYPWLLAVAPPLMRARGAEGLALALAGGYAVACVVAFGALARRATESLRRGRS
jgi:hypothetical protein